jgi:hypothetical protein
MGYIVNLSLALKLPLYYAEFKNWIADKAKPRVIVGRKATGPRLLG